MYKTSRIFFSITFEPNPKISPRPSEKLSRFLTLDLESIEPFFSKKKKTEGAAEPQILSKLSVIASTRTAFNWVFRFNGVAQPVSH